MVSIEKKTASAGGGGSTNKEERWSLVLSDGDQSAPSALTATPPDGLMVTNGRPEERCTVRLTDYAVAVEGGER